MLRSLSKEHNMKPRALSPVPLLSIALLGLVACAEDKTANDSADTSDTAEAAEQSVAALILRRLNPDQDLGAFKDARDAYVAELMAQPGAEVDREFEALIDFSIGAAPTVPVFVGFTQFEGPTLFQSAASALNGSAEETAFFQTFTPELFALLSPLKGGPASIASIANGAGQVLEVARRDLSAYADFDASEYEVARDAFLGLLGARQGVIGEYQWVSVADPNVVVGMTAYDSFEAWAAIWSDPAFYSAPEYSAFLGAYPPAGGYLTKSVK